MRISSLHSSMRINGEFLPRKIDHIKEKIKTPSSELENNKTANCLNDNRERIDEILLILNRNFPRISKKDATMCTSHSDRFAGRKKKEIKEISAKFFAPLSGMKALISHLHL